MSSLKASLRLEGKPINECCELLDHFFGAVLEEKRNRHEFLSEFPALLEDIFICGTDKKYAVSSRHCCGLLNAIPSKSLFSCSSPFSCSSFS